MVLDKYETKFEDMYNQILIDKKGLDRIISENMPHFEEIGFIGIMDGISKYILKE